MFARSLRTVLPALRATAPRMSVSAFVAPTASRIAVPSIMSIRSYGEDRYERPQNPPSTTLYVANLPYGISEQEILEHFSQYSATNARIPNNREGRPAGYSWVEFGSIEDAQAAKDALAESDFAGRAIRIDFGKNRSDLPQRAPNPPSNVLFMGGIADMPESVLSEAISNAGGQGFSVRIGLDRETMEPRGFAHVEFADVEAAQQVRNQLEGQSIEGIVPRIDFNKPREERSYGGGRAGSYGGGGSYGRGGGGGRY